jgi:hypothetical protein
LRFERRQLALLREKGVTPGIGRRLCPIPTRSAREWGIVYLTRPGELPDPESPEVEPGAKAEAGADSPPAK